MQENMENNRLNHELLSANDLISDWHFSRPMAYQLLNRKDMPVVCIGRRRFMHAALFREWLEQQAKGTNV